MTDTHATLHYAGNEFFVGISPSGHAVTIDVNGQRSAAPSPLELLLLGVGACTGADVEAILRKKRQIVTDYKIEVHSERRTEHPRSFKRIEIRHILRGKGLSEEAVSRAIELSTDKYCSAVATVRPTAEVVTKYEIHDDAG